MMKESHTYCDWGTNTETYKVNYHTAPLFCTTNSQVCTLQTILHVIKTHI